MDDLSRLIELFKLDDPEIIAPLAREISRKNNYQPLYTLLDETFSRSSLLKSQITALENQRLHGQLRILHLLTYLFPSVLLQHRCNQQSPKTSYLDVRFQHETISIPIDECKLLPITSLEPTTLLPIVHTSFVELSYSIEDISLPNILLKKVFDKPIYQGNSPINGNSISLTIDLHQYLRCIKLQYGININPHILEDLDPIPF